MYHDNVHLHSLTTVSSYTLWNMAETYPAQDFKAQGHYSKVKSQIKATS